MQPSGQRLKPLAPPMVFFFVASLLVAMLAEPCLGEPCADDPGESTIVQLTNFTCKCCKTLDQFLQENKYVNVLFYKTKGRLNIDINAKFERFADEWKWSRLSFGRVDTDQDRTMAATWVEPHMVPTTVLFKSGRPVTVQPKDFERIRESYQGNPEGQKWLNNKYMGADTAGSNLQYVVPLPSAKKHKKFLKAHDLVVVGHFKRENDKHHRSLQEAFWRIEHLEAEAGASKASTLHAAFVTLPSLSDSLSAGRPSLKVYSRGEPLEDFEAKEKEWSFQAVQSFLQQAIRAASTQASAAPPKDDL